VWVQRACLAFNARHSQVCQAGHEQARPQHQHFWSLHIRSLHNQEQEFKIFMLFPKQRWVGYVAMAYAFYVGIGVSMTIHWFSDFSAGAIIGSVIGVVVGKCFLLSQNGTISSFSHKQIKHPV
jgi:hypothetical protein